MVRKDDDRTGSAIAFKGGAGLLPALPRLTRTTTASHSWAVFLFLCLGLALLLRLQGLGGPSLWMDELGSLALGSLPWGALLGPVAQLEPNPPGYHLLVKLLTSLTDTGDSVLRLPSALAGAAAVLPLALFTRRAFGTKAAAIAALLLSLSAVQIHYSQQARSYALLFLAAATALWLLGQLLDPAAPPRRQRALAAGFVLASVLMVHLHTTAVFIVLALYAHAGVVLLASGRMGWRWLGRLAAMGTLILAGSAWWLVTVFRMTMEPDFVMSWLKAPDLAEALVVLGNVLGALYLNLLWGLAALICLLLLTAAGWMALRRRQAEALGLIAGLATGAAALIGMSQLSPVMLDRTALFLLVFALPLYGFALARMLRPGRGLFWPALALGALLLALHARGAANRHAVMAEQGHREGWREAVAALERRIRPGEPVLVLGAYEVAAIPHYAPRLLTASPPPLRGLPGREGRLGVMIMDGLAYAAPFDAAELCRLSARAGGFWTLGRENVMAPELAGLASWMRTRHGSVPVATEEYAQVVLRHWSPPKAACATAMASGLEGGRSP
jgi:hypothetical protein